jgi:GntR family transcriptional regulator/MocR family aminotransferase
VLVRLDRSAGVPLRVQLEDGLRELVRSGRVQAGAVLPSSRVLAGDLGVSRRLVVEAYAQLAAEGYLATDERSATRVGNVSAARGAEEVEEPRPARYDLRPGLPALSEFPRAAWLKAISAAVRETPDADLAYPDPRGSSALRVVVAEYLRRVRAVATDPGRIVISAGFTQALALLTASLGSPLVALEDPGLVARDHTVAGAGGRHVPVAVDQQGLRTDALRDSAADMVVCAPAHQFPVGSTLSPRRRSELLDWGRSTGLVVEDDYDAEFRYGRQPIGALQGLAPEHVAYVGSVSKTLAPALRLGWIVAPHSILEQLVETKRSADAGSPTLDQLALARLLSSGVYERHLRRARRRYRQQRTRLLEVLSKRLPSAEVGGAAAGLHVMLTLPRGADALDVVAAAAGRDLALAALERYTLTPGAGRGALVLGYGNIAPQALDEAVARLAHAIAEVRER